MYTCMPPPQATGGKDTLEGGEGGTSEAWLIYIYNRKKGSGWSGVLLCYSWLDITISNILEHFLKQQQCLVSYIHNIYVYTNTLFSYTHTHVFILYRHLYLDIIFSGSLSLFTTEQHCCELSGLDSSHFQRCLHDANSTARLHGWGDPALFLDFNWKDCILYIYLFGNARVNRVYMAVSLQAFWGWHLFARISRKRWFWNIRINMKWVPIPKIWILAEWWWPSW